jgi:TPR repeat protein
MIRKLGLIALLAATCQFAFADQTFDDNMAKAKKGDAAAQSAVAAAYLYGRGVDSNYETAHSWFLKAAEKGNTDAQFNLGVMYEQGQGAKQDYSTAAKWYAKASMKKHSLAEYRLGAMYENGKGVKQDYKKAADLYAQSAAQGQPEAKTAAEALAPKIAEQEAAEKAKKAEHPKTKTSAHKKK